MHHLVFVFYEYLTEGDTKWYKKKKKLFFCYFCSKTMEIPYTFSKYYFPSGF